MGLRYLCTTLVYMLVQLMLWEFINGRESIIDFKQSNKYKKREWIGDYFVQCVAYAMAHIELYGTNIQTGVILISEKMVKFISILAIWLMNGNILKKNGKKS